MFFYLGPPGKYVYLSPQNPLHVGWRCSRFSYFLIDIFLEIQDKKSSYILYLIDCIAYGFHLWYRMKIFNEICRKPIPLHPGLGKGLSNPSRIHGGLHIGPPGP